MCAATRILAVPLSAKVHLHYAAGQRLLGCTAAPCMAPLLQCSLPVGASCPACSLHAVPMSCWACFPCRWRHGFQAGHLVGSGQSGWGKHDIAAASSPCSLCKPACPGCHKALSAASTFFISCAATLECSQTDYAHHPAAAQCEKCQNNRAFFKEIQMRSADEPATVFYQCTKCPNRWKED